MTMAYGLWQLLEKLESTPLVKAAIDGLWQLLEKLESTPLVKAAIVIGHQP